MTDEVIAPVVDENQAATSEDKTVATPAPNTEAVPDENTTQGVVEKTYTQKEYDEATAKIRKKAEAVAERRALKVYAEKLEGMQQKPVERQPDTDNGKPTIAQFGENVEAYVEAVADWKMQQRDNEANQRSAEQQQMQTRKKADNLYVEAGKLPGFDIDAFEASLTPTIAGVVIDSDIAPKLMTYISEHPEEMERIKTLSQVRQAVEMGKLEATLSAAKQTKVSSAPAPIKPVGGRSGMTSKPPSEMNIEELRAFEKTRGARYS